MQDRRGEQLPDKNVVEDCWIWGLTEPKRLGYSAFSGTNQKLKPQDQGDQTMTTTTFKPGSTYYMRSVCDHNAVWTYEVVSRTAKQVKLQEVGKSAPAKSFGVKVYEGVEQCYPTGKYSMAPVLSADRIK